MDEVLAVGDAAFQQKCLDKMHDIRQQGRTIFFVSHNMPADHAPVQPRRAAAAGRSSPRATRAAVVNKYLSSSWNVGAERAWANDGSAGRRASCACAACACATRRAKDGGGRGHTPPFGIEITYDVLASGHALDARRRAVQRRGHAALQRARHGREWRRVARPAGTYTSTAWIPGNYSPKAASWRTSPSCRTPRQRPARDARKVVAFQVIDSQQSDTARGDYIGPMPGRRPPAARAGRRALRQNER